ncbi:hypothetical protein ACET3Z_027517 [Daucus carota]
MSRFFTSQSGRRDWHSLYLHLRSRAIFLYEAQLEQSSASPNAKAAMQNTETVKVLPHLQNRFHHRLEALEIEKWGLEATRAKG